MHASLRSESARPEAFTLLWTESTSEQVLVLSRLRTDGGLPEMAVNPWVRESPSFQRLEPSHATVCTQAPDQSAHFLRLIYCLGLNQLRNKFKSCLGCAPRENCPKWPIIHGPVKALLYIDLSLPTPPYARKHPIRMRMSRDLCVALD